MTAMLNIVDYRNLKIQEVGGFPITYVHTELKRGGSTRVCNKLMSGTDRRLDGQTGGTW
jgi:hypothetical protein